MGLCFIFVGMDFVALMYCIHGYRYYGPVRYIRRYGFCSPICCITYIGTDSMGLWIIFVGTDPVALYVICSPPLVTFHSILRE